MTRKKHKISKVNRGSLCEDSARGAIHFIDNRLWCLEHRGHLRPESIQDTFQYVKAAHPLAGASQFPPVANHPDLRTRSVADLALWADAVAHTCYDKLGFEQLARFNKTTRAQYASMAPGSVASIAFVAMYHSNAGVREAALNAVNRGKDTPPCS